MLEAACVLMICCIDCSWFILFSTLLPLTLLLRFVTEIWQLLFLDLCLNMLCNFTTTSHSRAVCSLHVSLSSFSSNIFIVLWLKQLNQDTTLSCCPFSVNYLFIILLAFLLNSFIFHDLSYFSWQILVFFFCQIFSYLLDDLYFSLTKTPLKYAWQRPVKNYRLL